MCATTHTGAPVGYGRRQRVAVARRRVGALRLRFVKTPPRAACR